MYFLKVVVGMASGEDTQLSQTEKSPQADKQSPVSEAGTVFGAGLASVSNSSAAASSVTETQSRQEQPQATAAPPKPR